MAQAALVAESDVDRVGLDAAVIGKGGSDQQRGALRQVQVASNATYL